MQQRSSQDALQQFDGMGPRQRLLGDPVGITACIAHPPLNLLGMRPARHIVFQVDLQRMAEDVEGILKRRRVGVCHAA